MQCLKEDARYAPAWARLGRIYRVMSKYGAGAAGDHLAAAEDAFERALAINPDLTIAHSLYAQLEVDLGRAQQAMLRLLERARSRGADPELFGGLVHACRFCGLLDASVAAHRHARRLDPLITTSVGQSYFLLGDYANVVAEGVETTPFVFNVTLAIMGRAAEATKNLRALEPAVRTRYGEFLAAARMLLEGQEVEALAVIHRLAATEVNDPEGWFHLARFFARLGEVDTAVSTLRRTIDGGYTASMRWRTIRGSTR